MAPVKLLPQLRPLDHALAEMQFWWGRTKRKRRNAARVVARSSGLLKTSDRLFLEPATETAGDESASHGPERTGQADCNWERRVHSVTAQAYGPRTCLMHSNYRTMATANDIYHNSAVPPVRCSLCEVACGGATVRRERKGTRPLPTWVDVAVLSYRHT
jgi:hypothetical protein